MDYLPRIADNVLKSRLNAFGAVLIEGPKWCGKTTTAMQQARSVIRLQDPDMREAYMATAQARPSNLLRGEAPELIDEWQDAPVLWDAVRVAVDDRQKTGQFILTGSNSVDSEQIRHSGTGRIARIRMLPMSLFESGESTGEVSLGQLFAAKDYQLGGEISPMTVNGIIFAACRGGWPASLVATDRAARLSVAQVYVEGVLAEDISRIDKVRRDPATAEAILRSYARNVSTLAKKSSMIKDVIAITETCSPNTFDDYVDALTRLFVIQDIDAWSPAVRSASAIRRGKKRGFVDPSIPIAILGLSPEMLEVDLKTFGFLFECMCIRDLRAYSQALGGKMSYYHDRYDLEADGVLHLSDGRYALLEFKLGSEEIEKGAAHLLEIKQLINEYNNKEKQILIREPDLLMIITAGPMAYTRPDGVHVVPLACLKD
ncbi:MAG: ATP-binding protein [Muribaculaceae bacterium]|nr:ATP-binding protein [Muribaculaceae bacterium]